MKIILQPHETIEEARAKDRLRIDAGKVHETIRSQPGIAGKAAIAEATGLTEQRVAEVIRRINRGETGHTRVEYTSRGMHRGTHAGEKLRGWFAMNLKRHHAAMDHADEHSALVEVGVRRSRLVRLVQAQGIPGTAAERVVASIELRLGVSVEAMSESDLNAFMDLLNDEETIEALDIEPEA